MPTMRNLDRMSIGELAYKSGHPRRTLYYWIEKRWLAVSRKRTPNDKAWLLLSTVKALRVAARKAEVARLARPEKMAAGRK